MFLTFISGLVLSQLQRLFINFKFLLFPSLQQSTISVVLNVQNLSYVSILFGFSKLRSCLGTLKTHTHTRTNSLKFSSANVELKNKYEKTPLSINCLLTTWNLIVNIENVVPLNKVMCGSK